MALHPNKAAVIRILFQKATDEELAAFKEGFAELTTVKSENRDEIAAILKEVCDQRGI